MHVTGPYTDAGNPRKPVAFIGLNGECGGPNGTLRLRLFDAAVKRELSAEINLPPYMTAATVGFRNSIHRSGGVPNGGSYDLIAATVADPGGIGFCRIEETRTADLYKPRTHTHTHTPTKLYRAITYYDRTDTV